MVETATPRQEEAVAQKRRFRVKILIALICAAICTAALLTVVYIGGGLSFQSVQRTWTVITGGAGDATFVFEDGYDDVFADLGSAVAAVGSSGVVVYDADGKEVARDALTVRNPAVSSGAGVAIAYGIGGRGIRVVDETGIIASVTFESDIVSCSVGVSSGFFAGGIVFAVCTEGTDNYKGKVVFYKLAGNGPEIIYTWDSGEGYVLQAEIAPGNNEFAILTLAPRGGRIVLLNRDSTSILGEYILDGAAIIEMGYLKSGTLIARTSDGLVAIDKAGSATDIYSFDEKTVAGYSDDGGSALAVYFENAGGETSGELVIIDERGNELGRMSTSRSLVWLSSNADLIAVLWDDGLSIYDRSLRLITSYPEASGMLRGYSRGGSRVAVFGSREGRAFSGKKE